MSEWEIVKEKGNEEFKKGNFNAAMNLYSSAIGKYHYISLWVYMVI